MGNIAMKALTGKELIKWWKNVKGVTVHDPIKHTREDGSVYYLMKIRGSINTQVYLENIYEK